MCIRDRFKLAKEKGVNTCLDTSGNTFTVEEPFFGTFNELMKYTDIFMLDIKQMCIRDRLVTSYRLKSRTMDEESTREICHIFLTEFTERMRREIRLPEAAA